MSNKGIVLVQLVKFALLEKQDCVECVLLQSPELSFER